MIMLFPCVLIIVSIPTLAVLLRTIFPHFYALHTLRERHIAFILERYFAGCSQPNTLGPFSASAALSRSLSVALNRHDGCSQPNTGISKYRKSIFLLYVCSSQQITVCCSQQTCTYDAGYMDGRPSKFQTRRCAHRLQLSAEPLVL